MFNRILLGLVIASVSSATSYAQDIVFDNSSVVSANNSINSDLADLFGGEALDDFTFSSTVAVTRVNWRGIYVSSAIGGGGDGIVQAEDDDFEIRIYSNFGGIPRTLLRTFSVGSEVNRSPNSFQNLGNLGFVLTFDYSADIDFIFLPGRTYWISILNDTVNDTDNFQQLTFSGGGNALIDLNPNDGLYFRQGVSTDFQLATEDGEVAFDNFASGISDGTVFSDLSAPIGGEAVDDFNLASTERITGVSWSGLYADRVFGRGDGIVSSADDDFEIRIYGDADGAPGPRLATFPVGNAVDRTAGEILRLGSQVYTQTFDFNANINFTATAGTTYWLSIVNNTANDEDDFEQLANLNTGSLFVDVNPSDGVFLSQDATANFKLTTGRILGDINDDAFVNFLDISPMISILLSGEFLFEADINQDGTVNFLDIGSFIALLSDN